ncbi:YaaA family protein [Gordonia liuliyuniae]|uniref:Peroxide stress protein YaaA n=1 Tax=Gordonia liuliyuniae TaxID=2911517 RepID=A0ABS9IRK9_9ACTN|nr:peroxide stress protein YaaA [Gordonia liuliyuniae]MCF8588194.1 peroxide stress protein YaaA [Gordonia liuliyuniae]
MLVILPPSETKSDGGKSAPLDLDSLSLPELNAVRRRIANAVVELAGDLAASRTALGLGATDAAIAEVARNAELWRAPTRPAITRYTGVLYDALDYPGMTRASKAKAADRLMIGSALFGVVSATDLIPAYRLSGGSKLPGLGTLGAAWKPALSPALDALDDFVVDLRSGVYQKLGPVDGAVSATVVTELANGSRKVVSHFNKHHKGLVAHELVRTRRTVRDVDGLAAVLSDAGQRVEITSPIEITVVTEG